jgi:BioD-like phosphotransacetylase family protein
VKKLYVAATQQHDGKTTVCVGLYIGARRRGYRACFIKPVGQRYLVEDGVKADEDAVLFKKALMAVGALQSLSPVTIPRGFTEEYIFNRRPEAIRRQILDAFHDVAAGSDMAIIEGTGHAGVGSVIDSSNAQVARLLGADCVIVAQGGIGRCIDEICLNLALLEKEGVRCLGAIINKVFEEKYDKVSRAVRQGLANAGVPCLGVIPYCTELTYPTVAQLRDELGLEALCGEAYVGNKVHSIIVGAMAPQNMIGYLKDGSLVVVPGDRVDNVVISVNAHLMSRGGGGPRIAALLLTGGLIPPLSIVNMLSQVDVPVLLSEEDTATAAYRARELVAKITPRDADKIDLAEKLVAENVDLEGLFGTLSG